MKKFSICIYLLAGIAFLAPAQTLEDYLVEAAENNPSVKSAWYSYMASLERVPQMGALPDPELTLGLFLRPMERFMGNQLAEIQLMQMFPWFGMLKTRQDEASKMAVMRYEAFREAKYALYEEVRKTWFQLYLLDERIRISNENLEILNTFERMALIRYQGGVSSSATPGGAGASMQENSSSSVGSSGMSGMGKSSPTMNQSTDMGANAMQKSSMGSSTTGMADVLRIKIEKAELENEISFLTDSRKALEVSFNRLLNRGEDGPIVISEPLSETVPTINGLVNSDSLFTNNPMLRMISAEEQLYVEREEMARLESRPMLGAGVSYMPFTPRMENGMSMGGNDMIMPMVSLTLPIYRKKYTSAANEARQNQVSLREQHSSVTNQLQIQLAVIQKDLADAERRMLLASSQSALARQTLDLLITGYSTNGNGFEEILDVQRQLLNYQLRHITAKVELHSTYATLQRLFASEEINISLEKN